MLFGEFIALVVFITAFIAVALSFAAPLVRLGKQAWRYVEQRIGEAVDEAEK